MDNNQSNFLSQFIHGEDEVIYPIIKNDTQLDTQLIINILKTIYDPEIDYSIYDLGLIYGITVESNKIHILMTLTSANCPEAQSLPQSVKDKLLEQFPDYEISLDVTFEPSWTVDNMTDEVKLGLNLL